MNQTITIVSGMQYPEETSHQKKKYKCAQVVYRLLLTYCIATTEM